MLALAWMRRRTLTAIRLHDKKPAEADWKTQRGSRSPLKRALVGVTRCFERLAARRENALTELLRRRTVAPCLALLLLVFAPAFAARAQQDCQPNVAPGAEIYLRVNQMGYLPDEPKVALALTNSALDGGSFAALNDSGGVVFNGEIGADRGAYGNFAHLYELDFSNVSAPGAYRLSMAGNTSPCFNVGADIYAAVVPTTLEFFRVQRSGDTDPLLHAPSHLNDGIAAGGALDGQRVDATGGWYDAGDYVKFVTTNSYALDMLLVAYVHHPEAFGSGEPLPAVLAEARVGLDWLMKMWDEENGILYYQVSDARDHELGWRMPEDDDANLPPRPVYACQPGRGANVAGKAAAALALAAFIWGNPEAAFYDPELASAYLVVAKGLYRYGQANPAAQEATDEMYPETNWEDEMALGAAELYRASGLNEYLDDARAYAEAAGNTGEFYWGDIQPLAHYEIARLDPSYTEAALSYLQGDLDDYRWLYETDTWGAAIEPFYWGSGEILAGRALTALWYADLSGDNSYLDVARAQRDYLLGVNPWGMSFGNGIGTVYPHHPHHNLAVVTGQEPTGFWAGGPIAREGFEAIGIELWQPDTLALFQTDEALYHDDSGDFTTNEPTVSTNATALALLAWFVE